LYHSMESTARSALGAMHKDIMMFRTEATLRKGEASEAGRRIGVTACRRIGVTIVHISPIGPMKPVAP
jgi:hypothetical protein